MELPGEVPDSSLWDNLNITEILGWINDPWNFQGKFQTPAFGIL